MSETTPAAKGPAQVQLKPQTIEPTPVPVSEVRPEDIAILSLEYRDGQPVIVVTGGKYIPAAVIIEDRAGTSVGGYVLSPRGTTFTPGDYTGAVTMMFDAVTPV